MNQETDFIDLRSDTMTRPTPKMRQVMAEAEVGDDMVGEDPTVNLLEAYCCELFQKEAAVFCCSGTQSNQAAIWAHTHPGDEILIEQHGHLVNYESGAPAALSGVSTCLISGDQGRLDLEHLAGKLHGPQLHFPKPTLLCLENTTNIGGGRSYPLEQMERVCLWAKEHGLKRHLDGARLFNACAAQGYRPFEVAEHFDSISICFSKGLGCPLGSLLVGDAELIQKARRARKIFGGALRQAGIVAAAAVYALQHHRDRLVEDHEHARQLAAAICDLPGLSLQLENVETNIFFFEIDPALMTGAEFVRLLADNGIKLYTVGPQRLRVVTHLDVNSEMINRAAEGIRAVMSAAV